MTPQQFVERLRRQGYQVRDVGSEIRAQCPAHQGEDLNMTVRPHPEGGTVCTCHSHHCTRQAIAEAVGLTMDDLVAEPRKGNGTEP